jgi:hypothetical protein
MKDHYPDSTEPQQFKQDREELRITSDYRKDLVTACRMAFDVISEFMTLSGDKTNALFPLVSSGLWLRAKNANRQIEVAIRRGRRDAAMRMEFEDKDPDQE